MTSFKHNLGSDIISLVRMFAAGYDYLPRFGQEGAQDAMALMAASKDLINEVNDYETSAREAGWKTADMTPGLLVRGVVGQAQAESAMGWREACRKSDLAPCPREVRNVFIVPGWLGKCLHLLGEYVDADYGGLAVWANWREDIDGIMRNAEVLHKRIQEQLPVPDGRSDP